MHYKKTDNSCKISDFSGPKGLSPRPERSSSCLRTSQVEEAVLLDLKKALILLLLLIFTMHPQHLVGIKETLYSTWWTWFDPKPISYARGPFRLRRQSFWTWKSHWFYSCCLFFTMHPQHLVGIKESLSSTWRTWFNPKPISFVRGPFRSRRQSFWTWKRHWFYSCCLFFTMHPQHLVGIKESLSSTWRTWFNPKPISFVRGPFRSRRQSFWTWKRHWFYSCCLFFTMHPQHLLGIKETLSSTWWTWFDPKNDL